jgi:hypothetical protein
MVMPLLWISWNICWKRANDSPVRPNNYPDINAITRSIYNCPAIRSR